MKTETGVLILSTVAALAIGIVAMAAALLSGSQAILLDGLYNLAFFFTALFTLRVARLLARPDDATYPFGYLYFEPLINTVKGLLILGVSGYALFNSIVTLFSGGQELTLGPALVYAAAATASCAATWLALRRANRSLGSPLIGADIGNWAVNTLISAGVFAAFVLAFLLKRAGLDTAALYVDPVLVGIVVLISLGVPIRMAGEGLLALLNRAPPAAVTAAIETLVRDRLSDVANRAIYVRTVKPGRTAYVTIHVLLPEDSALDLATADGLRRRVIDGLVAAHAPVIVDVVFTAIEEYAAPTSGFGAGQASGT
jgi:cation diffusion facilitator family transporter